MHHVKKLLTSRSYREKIGQFAAEGTKLLEEAAMWYPHLQTVIVQEGVELCELPENTRVVEVPESVMLDISQMDAPQGVVFVCKMPQKTACSVQPGSLILDGIQDPGNVGTILRTADALEIPIVLTEGCADVYSPKTVRASMGAVFRTQPKHMTRREAAASCREQQIPLFATAMSTDACDIRDVPLDRAAVVIGSEGQGVSRELFDCADRKIIIPMNPRCESLNAAVAAVIVMWQMKR